MSVHVKTDFHVKSYQKLFGDSSDDADMGFPCQMYPNTQQSVLGVFDMDDMENTVDMEIHVKRS